MGMKRGSDELMMYDDAPTADTESDAVSNGSKKLRFEDAPPSRVLHIRKLPNDVMDTEIIALGLSFGKVTNILTLKGKNQAFLEMDSEESAVAMVNYYNTVTPHVRHVPVYIQYSNHKELRTDPTNQRTQAMLQAVSSVHSDSPPQSQMGDLLNMPCSPVLRIIVENMFYPVTLDVLQQIFSKFGSVMKIITFTKNNQFQALLQYGEPLQAQRAKMALDGQNIYNSCCTLRIDFSKMVNLNVKYNNDKSCDYTRPELPGGGLSHMDSVGGGFNKGTGSLLGSIPGAMNPMNPMAAVAATGRMGMGQSGSTPVVLVSNLNEEMVTPESLFTLFGVYGDVQRVKILYNKKDSALVQLCDPSQAQLAMSHLNGLKMYGNVIRVTMSKHQNVAQPQGNPDDSGLTKDFTNSQFHRFKKPGSRNFNNIFPPSATLHISNIQQDMSDDDLEALFCNGGGTVKAVKFFKDHTMALLQMATVEEATQALIDLHNYSVGGNQYLRVSFSKSTI
ncbi:unnamed protein product [Knipowitschia caucasica]